MTRIAVLGGTGYAGGYVVAEALRRGHDVVVASRHAGSAELPDGAEGRDVDVSDPAALGPVLDEVDVVVSALSPRGNLGEGYLDAFRAVGDQARERGVRLVSIGGFTSLRPAADAERYLDSGELPLIPPDLGLPPMPDLSVRREPRQMVDALVQLIDREDDLDWTFISPGLLFGAHVPGEATGKYRVGGEVALLDDQGVSAISGADFALAVVDEIERADHRGEHIGIAY